MWGDLMAEIEGFFLPRNNREWARAQLLRLRQGPRQRIDGFLAQFETLKVQSGCPDEYAQDLLERAVLQKILEKVYLQAVARDMYLNLCDLVCDMGRARSSSLSTPRGPHNISRAPIHHHPLLHLAVACQWISALQTRTPNLVGRGYNAIIAKGLATSHESAHSHAGPGNNSRPGPHSIKEAIPMMKE